METSEKKQPDPTVQSAAAPDATQQSSDTTASPPSQLHLQSGADAQPKTSTSADAPENTTPPFSPSSQTPVLAKEQEEFTGVVDVNDDIPTEKDLEKVAELLVLDADGQSRPFKEIYDAPHRAPRQLIVFIRHFFCGVRTPRRTWWISHGSR
jgi:hypothetical protein